MRTITSLLLASTLAGCATAHSRPTSMATGDDERPRIVEPTPHRRSPALRRAGYALIGIGGVFAIGAIAAGAASNPPGCHDENCWLPQMTAGLSFGSAGGALMIAGGVMAFVGRDR